MRRRARFPPGTGEKVVTERRALLSGLQPQPLGSYFAALGVLRICAIQHDARVRGAFTHNGFVLDGIDADELTTMLLDRYVPTPVLSPWNNASGFYDSDKGEKAANAMKELALANNARFIPLLRATEQARALIRGRGYDDAPKDDAKAAFIALLRSSLPDDAIGWIDAVAVVDDEDFRAMPVLGSGGNEGVFEYSGAFMTSLVDTLLGDRDRSRELLGAAIFNTPTSKLVERPAGQFNPGSAGGFNTGPGFESKSLPNNPWAFILLIEGTIVWASAIASRQRGIETRFRFAVSPFTVRHRAAGYGSASKAENDSQRVRAEVWVPVWQRPAPLSEVSRFIAEGRVDLRGPNHSRKHAIDSVDFVDAVASLGVDRGVQSFVRYAFMKRRGDSFLALPAGVLPVQQRREIDLVRQLDGQLAQLDTFLRQFKGEGPPAQIVSWRRAIDDARFDVAQRGGHDAMRLLVRAIGALEMVLARRDPGKSPSLSRPLGGLAAAWVDACGDSVEVRLAAALASIAATGGAGPMRAYLAPLDPREPRRYAPAARALAWEGVDLADRLANVLRRRFLDARMRSGERATKTKNPTWGACAVSLTDVANFLDGSLDERALEELMFGFSWVTWVREQRFAVPSLADGVLPLRRVYCLLRLLFQPSHIVHRGEELRLIPDPAIVSLLRAGRVTDAVAIAHRQLRTKGLRPRRVIDRDVDDGVFGRRLAAALLIPTWEGRALIAGALVPDPDSDRPQTGEHI